MAVGKSVRIERARYGCHRGDCLRVSGSSAKLWKLEGGKTVPKDHEGAGWTWLPDAPADEAPEAAEFQRLAGLAQGVREAPRETPAPGEAPRLTIACVDGYLGYVIDGALDDGFLALLDATRLSLEVDTSKKKTAAARRFVHDADGELRAGLEAALVQALPAFRGCPAILPWMRFLEYTEPEGALPPHTDALVRCKETGQWSTHTVLVYSAACAEGGETIMLPWPAEDSSLDEVGASFAVQPLRGRIFCFPHGCLHEGAPTVDVPKVLLRAELVLPGCAGRL